MPPKRATTRASAAKGSSSDDDKKPAAARRPFKSKPSPPAKKVGASIPRKPSPPDAAPVPHPSLVPRAQNAQLFHGDFSQLAGVAAANPAVNAASRAAAVMALSTTGASAASVGSARPSGRNLDLSSFQQRPPAALESATVIVPGSGLSGFNMAAAAVQTLRNNGVVINKDCTLRAVIVSGPHFSFIFFRVEPIDSTLKTVWPEKVWFDDLRKGAAWVRNCGIDEKTLEWFHEDEAQLNAKGYPIRLFVVKLQATPAKGDVIRLGRFICENINAAPGNQTTISVSDDEHQFFWIDRSDVTMEEVLGTNKALSMLLAETTGGQTPMPDYWVKHHDIARSYFRSGNFSIGLAQFLQAPPEEIHPSEQPGQLLANAPALPALEAAGIDDDDEGDDGAASDGDIVIETVDSDGDSVLDESED